MIRLFPSGSTSESVDAGLSCTGMRYSAVSGATAGDTASVSMVCDSWVMLQDYDCSGLGFLWLGFLMLGKGIVGLEGMAEHFHGFSKVLLVEHVGHTHFVVSHARSGIEA